MNMEKYYCPFFEKGAWYFLIPGEHGPPEHVDRHRAIIVGPISSRDSANALANKACQAHQKH